MKFDIPDWCTGEPPDADWRKHDDYYEEEEETEEEDEKNIYKWPDDRN